MGDLMLAVAGLDAMVTAALHPVVLGVDEWRGAGADVVWIHGDGSPRPDAADELHRLCEQAGVPLIESGAWADPVTGVSEPVDGRADPDPVVGPVTFSHLAYGNPLLEHGSRAGDAGFPTGEPVLTPPVAEAQPGPLVTMVRELVKVWNDTDRIVATGGAERRLGNLVAHLDQWTADLPLSAPFVVLSERELATMRSMIEPGAFGSGEFGCLGALSYMLKCAHTGVEAAADRLLPLRTEALPGRWRRQAEQLHQSDWPTKRDRRRAKVLDRCADELQAALAADRADPESAPGIAEASS